MATLNGQLEILQRRRLHGHRMHGDTQSLAEHAAGVAHATRFVDDIRRRRGLNYFEAVKPALGSCVGEETQQMRVGDERSVERDGGPGRDAGRRAAGHRNQHVLDARIGVVLGGSHSLTDRLLSKLDAGDGSRLDALGLAQRSTQHLQIARLSTADQADHLGRSDIEDRHEARAEGRPFGIARTHADRLAHQVAFPRATGCLSPFFSTKNKLSRWRKSISEISRSSTPLSTIKCSSTSSSFAQSSSGS